jgi:hypothetical protein
LAADAFVVIDPKPIGFWSSGEGFFVEKINAVLDWTMQFAQRRAGAAAAIFVHHRKERSALRFFFSSGCAVPSDLAWFLLDP